MAEDNDERAGARVHWLVAAPLRSQPTGETFSVKRDDFAEVLARAGLRATAVVRDCLGADDTRSFELELPELRAFTTKHVVGSQPVLGALLEVASSLGKAQKPTTEEAVAAIEAAVGAGRLSQAVRELLDPPAPAASPGAEAAAGSLEEIADAGAGARAARSAIDMFVRSARKDAPQSGGIKLSGAKQARRMIEDAVYATASDILSSPAVAPLEGAWRGLKLMIDQCPPAAGIHVEVIDVAADGALDAIRARPEEDPFDEPDVIFLPFAVAGAEALGDLARFAEERLAPVIVGVEPAALGAADVASMASALDEGGEPTEAWEDFRRSEEARWLCAVANRVAVASEGAGVAKRACLASGVWALAAMLSASYRDSGSFARLTGKPGALQAPGLVELTGRHEGHTAPTETFLPINPQTTLAAHGVIGLGSPKDDAHVVLARTPTASGADDAAPLPAQILTGRIVRFASWVRHQIPENSEPQEMGYIFRTAAEVFLFPGLEEVAKIKADIAEDDDGKTLFVISAKVDASHAGVPFEMGFTLPLVP